MPEYLTQSCIHDPENGLIGTCLAASIAMVIGVPESEIPTRYLHVETGLWWETLQEDLEKLGWEILYAPWPDLLEPKGWHIINGPSPRNLPHSCLGYRGELIWDPHPSRDGLVEVTDYYLLRRIDGES